MTRASRSLLTTALTAVALGTTDAIDAVLKSFTCNEQLPVYASAFRVMCSGQAECTFGNTATIRTTLNYEGLESSTVYATARVKMMTQTYELFTDQELELCDANYVTPDLQYGVDDDYCPTDGKYSVVMDYDLPQSTDDIYAWLTTGFPGVATILLYDDVDETSLMGECEFHLSTTVTPSAESNLFMPSAALTAGYAIALLLVLVSLVFAVRFRRNLKRKQRESGRSSSRRRRYKKMGTSADKIRPLA